MDLKNKILFINGKYIDDFEVIDYNLASIVIKDKKDNDLISLTSNMFAEYCFNYCDPESEYDMLFSHFERDGKRYEVHQILGYNHIKRLYLVCDIEDNIYIVSNNDFSPIKKEEIPSYKDKHEFGIGVSKKYLWTSGLGLIAILIYNLLVID